MGDMPKSVIWYERLSYAGVALGLPMLLLTWSNTSHYLKKSPVLYLLAIAAVFAVQIFWIWLVARKKQNWARWVSAGAIVVGIPAVISDFNARYRLYHIATVIYCAIFLIFAVAVAMLFLPDARTWFRTPRTGAN